MFDAEFEHYLTFGTTDQETMRELTGHFTGLMVPGTVAAFQREGTGGFVLALSATEAHTPYAIDPRFPLFQQALHVPKKSHLALAEILGRPSLVSKQQPQPADFDDGVIDGIAEKWAEFNVGYRDAASAKFTKYAKRLKEDVTPEERKGPTYVIAPYVHCEGPGDPWWGVSRKLFDRTHHHLGARPCVRVVAAKEARYLGDLLADVDPNERVAVWVSSLDELQMPTAVLAEYAAAIAGSKQRTFAMYGGFFSVLLSSVGLGGSCHGIGFGEHRDYLELPQSGPPPARYYLPRVHRYVSQELAYQLWLADASLAECQCGACNGEPPIDLDYHSLMKHSVLCRSMEIEEWVGLKRNDAVARLAADRKEFLAQLRLTSDLPRFAEEGALRSTEHLQRWIDALGSL